MRDCPVNLRSVYLYQTGLCKSPCKIEDGMLSHSHWMHCYCCIVLLLYCVYRLQTEMHVLRVSGCARILDNSLLCIYFIMSLKNFFGYNGERDE